jgi:diaminopimelate decarboxylase
VYLPQTWPHVFSVFDKSGTLKMPTIETPMTAMDIAGPLCFSGDILARKVTLPLIETGDYVVVHDTGAYNYAMYSKFNSIPAPALYAIRRQLQHPSDQTELNPNKTHSRTIQNQIDFALVKARESVAETLNFWGPPAPLEWQLT